MSLVLFLSWRHPCKKGAGKGSALHFVSSLIFRRNSKKTLKWRFVKTPGENVET